MTDWQPIDTIPDDVMEALLYGQLDGEISGLFDHKSRVVGRRNEVGGAWYVESDCIDVAVIPTNWMPLPPPPTPTPDDRG